MNLFLAIARNPSCASLRNLRRLPIFAELSDIVYAAPFYPESLDEYMGCKARLHLPLDSILLPGRYGLNLDGLRRFLGALLHLQSVGVGIRSS